MNILERTSSATVRRVAAFPGSFHPLTVAHLDLATSALAVAEEVLFVLPAEFPHKRYDGVGFAARFEMLRLATAHEPRFAVGSSRGGLFLDIAREVRAAYPEKLEHVYLLCGRDAAERIVSWDYGEPGFAQLMLKEFELLVAARAGDYSPPPELRSRIHSLPISRDWMDFSATAVREKIRRGEPWRHLVPAAIADQVDRLYS